ncbi:SymE family type I addiction module toxin [Dyadobacter aurulentus]|uniref:SymE family type I addiction module toxin n=1 Tax=Dyadobacter sp. UC 10 TaxID=2605428 RepID=UPI0011F3FD56|nr:SymE family type I addiction module toxin [Dyadobacter sp. UC 10]KAA0992955.1 type I addiction module toxin, SymE family [Dyadobacter sp. UC 10]
MTHEKKSSNPSERHLTVYSKYVPRGWYQYVRMPEIRLCGKWLLDAGFACGDEVTVRLLEGKLEISLKPVEEPEPAPVRKRRSSRKEMVS